jgi:two-component system, NtrC family, sensor kinase
MTLQIAAMIVGLLLVSLASLWGLNGLRQDYGLALSGYQQLRRVYDVGAHLEIAQTLLNAQGVDRNAALREVEKARTRFQASFTDPTHAESPAEPLSPQSQQMLANISGSLDRAAKEVETNYPNLPDEQVIALDQQAVGQALPQIASLTAQIGQEIRASEDSARNKLHRTMIAVGILAGAVIAGSVLIGWVQYRAVMRPLRGLGKGVRRIARGQFKERLSLGGSEEFAALAGDFNGMAGELDGFYHLLEEKVAANTRELIRSERLASVGFLAAGVAHEINNPLGVIAGYAEYSIEQLKRTPAVAATAPVSRASSDDSTRSEVASALQIICDEAFRCKDITAKLLTLAHPGQAIRQRVSMAEVASTVVSIAAGVREYRDRQLSTTSQPSADLTVLAVEPEMKQVVLNLALNGLEASPPTTGRVTIDVSRKGDLVVIAVTDNGRGMTPQTIERAFEPFFTERPTRTADDDGREPGTGLGLSITHAIVKDHVGRISAFSDGPGTGSRFIVELPAAAAIAVGNGSTA